MRQGRLQPLIHREVAILIQEAHERLLFVLPGGTRVNLGIQRVIEETVER